MGTTKGGAFKPWANDFKYGRWALIAGAVMAWLAWVNQDIKFGLAAAAVVWFAQFKLRKGYYRRRGKVIETLALREKDLPKGWKFQAGRMVQTGGDIDFYIEAPGEKAKFSIEHKTLEAITVKHRILGFGEPYFLDAHGKPLRVDPVPQTMRNAEAVGATPVLWLSKGDAKTRKLKTGLIIVQGSRKKLLRAIGARGWLF